MNREARHAAVVALIELAGSSAALDRADAGRSLARFAEMPETSGPLLALVLDGRDTFVTLATAEALLRRQDSPGIAAVATALASAHDQEAYWIETAVEKVFGVYAEERDAAKRQCETLLQNADEQTRYGADELRAMLAEIKPILYPA